MSKKPLQIDGPLLTSENVLAFYSCYTNSNHIVWPIPYDKMKVYELYRDGVLIAHNNPNQQDDKYYDFSIPCKFDHDKHTNLFFKSSTHKYYYEDENIKRYHKYKYHVIGKFFYGDREILLDEVVSRNAEVYTE